MARRALSLLFLASAMNAAGSASAACDVESFGQKKESICTRNRCGAAVAPREIMRIGRGVYSEHVGLFINDGYARWVGLDLDRMAIVEVQRFAGKQRALAIKQLRKMKQNSDHYRRETRNARAPALEVIHRKAVAASALGEVVCAANALWAEKANLSARPPVASMSDSHNKLYLVDRGAAKDFGGPGELNAAPRNLRDNLDKLQKIGGSP
jgi:hypothetical protein